MGMKVNLSHCFKQIARSHSMHGAVLEEFERHLRETIRGEHTLQELAEVYCLDQPALKDRTDPEGGIPGRV